jgi:hypothetical protein
MLLVLALVLIQALLLLHLLALDPGLDLAPEVATTPNCGSAERFRSQTYGDDRSYSKRT